MKIFKTIFASAAVAALMLMGSCGNKTEKAAEEAETEVAEVVETGATVNLVVVLAEGEEIAPAEGKLIVIDFNATWCGPCKQFTPTFEAVAEENAGKAFFYEVDVDVHPELAAKYNVESIPMVVYIRPDGTVESTVGLLDKETFAAAVAEKL